MLGNPGDWEFVIGDIDVIDDGNKKKLYFINEKSKKIEIANAQQNNFYNTKYRPDGLESLSTGLSVIADLSGNNNKENRISKLKSILIEELSNVYDDGTKFNNEGLNKQYSTISNEINYIDYVTKFQSIDSIINSDDTSGLEKILVDKLKNVLVSSPAASWSNILKNQKMSTKLITALRFYYLSLERIRLSTLYVNMSKSILSKTFVTEIVILFIY